MPEERRRLYLPLDFRHVFGEEATSVKEFTISVGTFKEQSLHGQPLESKSHNLPHVHTGYHLLVAVINVHTALAFSNDKDTKL